MSYITEDRILENAGGLEGVGARFDGSDAVKRWLVSIWFDLPDISLEHASYFGDVNRGC
jgi:hypothetical protein